MICSLAEGKLFIVQPFDGAGFLDSHLKCTWSKDRLHARVLQEKPAVLCADIKLVV